MDKLIYQGSATTLYRQVDRSVFCNMTIPSTVTDLAREHVYLKIGLSWR